MPAEEKPARSHHYVPDTTATKPAEKIEAPTAKTIHEIAESIRGCKCDSGEMAALAAKVDVLAAKYEKK